jgi:protein gp37
MAENTKIEWTDHTFNPWTGCTKVSPGCDHCYAEGWSKRAGDKVGKWGSGAPRVRTTPANWAKPLKWQANAASFMAEHGRRQRVFCASLADVFDNEVPPAWRAELFALIAATPDLDWLLLTKRIGNVAKMIEAPGMQKCGLPENVWLGATITSQAEADRDIPKLLSVPAKVRFLSMEPLLGPVQLSLCDCDQGSMPGPGGVGGVTCPRCQGAGGQNLDWVIVGGESGPGARPMHPDWARSLRDQCASAGVPFLFKQWGNWRAAVWFDGPDAELDEGDDFIDLDRVNHQFLAADGRTWDTSGGRHMYPPLPLGHWCLMVNEGKKAAGRLLDGVEHNRFPELRYG